MYIRHREFSMEHWRRLAALPAQGVTLEHAARALALWARLTLADPLEPHIERAPDGAVMFGWTDGRAVVTISLSASGQCEWSCEDGDVLHRGVMDDTEFVLNVPEELSRALGAIEAGPAMTDEELALAKARARDDEGDVSPLLLALEISELHGARRARAVAATGDAAFWEARRAR